jgi:hypothetical protein
MGEALTAEDVGGVATTGVEVPPASFDNIAGGWRDAETPVAAKASDAETTPMADV